MRRTRVIAAVVVSALVAGAAGWRATHPGHRTRVMGVQIEPDTSGVAARAGELIVRLSAGAWPARGALHAALGGRPVRTIDALHLQLVKLPKKLSVSRAQSRYRARAEVVEAAPNLIAQRTVVQDEPGFSQQWGLDNTGQAVQGRATSADADVDALEALQIAWASPEVTVAVVDTGDEADHPDLRDSLKALHDQASDSANAADTVGHGTHVAGIIGAAVGNRTGVAGVGWGARLLGVRFDFTSFGGLEAMYWARDHGAKILNASWEGKGSCPGYLADGLADLGRSGVLVAAAAGNDTSDNDASPVWPASCPGDNVLSVAATDPNDALSGFSNWGGTSVDLAAPGSSIYSTLLHGSYGYMSGTSMAAPLVAGAAAVVWSAHPSFGPADVKLQLMQSVDKLPALSGRVASGGRLNLRAAVGVPDRTPPTPPPPAPVPATPPPPDAYKRSEESKTKVAGLWTSEEEAAASGGSYLQTAVPLARITYAFDGTAVRWIGQTGPQGGVAEVYLDDAYVGDVDLRTQRVFWQRQLFARSLLPGGAHELAVVQTTRRVGAFVYVDAFESA